jgi:hypothetical protein
MSRRNKFSLIVVSLLILLVLSLAALKNTRAELFNPCIYNPYPNPEIAQVYPYPYPQPNPSCSFIPVIFRNW